MPMYSDEIVSEVISRNDIVEVISQHVHLQKKGTNYFGLCPFHNEKTSSFSVSQPRQMYYCFGCHKGGNVATFLRDYENISFSESLQQLAERAGIQLPQRPMGQEERAKANQRDQLYAINRDAATYFFRLLRHPKGRVAHDYFIKRQLSEETMKNFGLGYADKYGDDLYTFLKSKGYSDDILRLSGVVAIDEARGGYDKFWNRAMFPIMDVNGKVIAFGGRVMGEGEPKYLNSPETPIFDKSRTLYGINLAKKSRRNQLILCEGYMDVIALHQAGFDCAVASLGTALTSGHANLLRRYSRDVYLSYDSDGAGRKAAIRAITILRESDVSCKVINMEPYKDPDEFIKALGPEAYQERIDQAENSFMFIVRLLGQEYDMSDPAGKTKFFEAVAEQLLVFEEELERNNYIDAIATKYDVGVKQLRDMVNRRGTKAGLVSQRREYKSGIQKRNTGEEGMMQSERMLLTWMVENEWLYAQVKPYIKPDDFTEGVYAQVAEILYERLESGTELNLGTIVTLFDDEEAQRQVSEIFNTTTEGLSKADFAKALRETVFRVKQNSLNQKSRNLDKNDEQACKSFALEKIQAQKLRNLNFHIPT